jgi:hypothetical protein
MFQFPRLPPHTYLFSMQYWPMTTSGFPHSDIHGSMLAYSSPWHFGVRPVLLRLLAPRHPPCALPTFTCSGCRYTSHGVVTSARSSVTYKSVRSLLTPLVPSPARISTPIVHFI